MKHVRIIFGLIFTLAVLAGCSNDLSQKKDDGIVIRGSVASSGRSAIFSNSSVSIAVSAVEKGAAAATAINAKVYGTEFVISLPKAGTWTFTAEAKNKDNVVVLKRSQDKQITLSFDEYISLSLAAVSNLKGSVNLPMTNDSTKVKKMTVTCSDNGGQKFNTTTPIVLNSKTFSYAASDIAAGSYTVVFNFMDYEDNVLFSAVEIINVYGGLCTDTWYGSEGEYFRKKGSICNFVITDTILYD